MARGNEKVGRHEVRVAALSAVLLLGAGLGCSRDSGKGTGQPTPERPDAGPTVTASAQSPAAASSPSRERAVRRIRASKLFRSTASAERALRRAITVETTAIDNERLAIGASRFGGAPDVPEGFSWPMHVPPREDRTLYPGETAPLPDGKRKYPLHFLAQIDLSALAKTTAGESVATGLPTTGFLYFFYDAVHGGWGYDPKAVDGAQVIYIDVPKGKLRRLEPPSKKTKYPSCSLAFSNAWSLPHPADALFEALDPANDAYALHDKLSLELLGSAETSKDGHATPRHHLLGHPAIVQNDMRMEAQLVSHGINAGDGRGYQDPRVPKLAAGVVDWNLLLQIDTDDTCPGWMWGDTGRLYFWIRDTDLRAKRFDEAWMALQCY